MFDNIGSKIKGIAIIFVVLSVIGGGIWLIYSISQYVEYGNFLQYGNTTRYYDNAYLARQGIIYAIILLISGIISSFFIYGFGELIEHVENIDYKLNGQPKEYKEENVSDEEIIAELEKEEKNEMTRAELYDKWNNK